METAKVFGNPAKQQLYADLVDALVTLFGVHPGFRAAHAKGIVCHGTFTPVETAAALSRAAHFQNAVPVTVRFSNGTGLPNIPDFEPDATPKGMAIRFHTPAGDTDIVSHSANGFAISTAEEFLELLRALPKSGPDAPKPTPVEQFIAKRPRTLEFLALPKPTPASFGSESFFALNAFKFTNAADAVQLARYFIKPVTGNVHLDAMDAAKKSPNFLFEELPQRLAIAPISFHLSAQLAMPGDPTHDGSITWPDDRPQLELGTLSIVSIDPDSDAAQKKLIYDPARLIDGIDFGDDPLPLDRSGVYAVSFGRRMA